MELRASDTPICTQLADETGQPHRPWSWPWLAVDFPECWCESNCEPSRDCSIHGDWLARYASHCLATA